MKQEIIRGRRDYFFPFLSACFMLLSCLAYSLNLDAVFFSSILFVFYRLRGITRISLKIERFIITAVRNSKLINSNCFTLHTYIYIYLYNQYSDHCNRWLITSFGLHRSFIMWFLLHSWLKHYPTSRKNVCSFPVEVIEFFNWSNPSSRTMALESTQPLTDMSTRNLPGGKGWRVCRADSLTADC
jgi:hypothetical protein